MQKQKQKLSQKRLQALLLREKLKLSTKRRALLFSIFFTGGVLGRIALQTIPSVEPLTPLAIFLGFMGFGIDGLSLGALGFATSNFFVFGGQGPWSIFQAIGAGIASLIGYLFGKLKRNYFSLILATGLGIFIYELIVTVPMGFLVSPLIPFWIYLITSLPFSFIHLVSSIGFTTSFYEFEKRIKNWVIYVERQVLGIRINNLAGIGLDNRLLTKLTEIKLWRRKIVNKNNNKLWRSKLHLFIKTKKRHNSV